MNETLIIVGNGFDLAHNLDTKYGDYRNFLIQNDNLEIVKYFESNSGDVDPKALWNNIEESIGLLAYEDAYIFLKKYGDDDWRDSYHHDFQNEVEKKSLYWPGIKDNLREWIKSINYTKPRSNLLNFIKKEYKYLSFNYTSTLEFFYNINPDNICYLHGNALRDEELILGHAHQSYYPEWDDNEDTDVRLLEAGEFMENFREETIKNVSEIIKQNIDFFNSSVNFKKIYVLGLSYNEVDLPYLKFISDNNPNAEWYFSWFSDSDFTDIDEFAFKINVKEYEKVQIDTL